MMENQDPAQNRPPSRTVKLLFDQLWTQTFGKGNNPTQSDYSEHSHALTTEEAAKYHTSGGRGRLKALREAKGLTAQELARRVGYSLEVYQNIEDGPSNMGRKMAEKVARELGCSVEDLLDGSDHPPSNGTLHGTVGEIPEIALPSGQKARFVPLLSMAQCGHMMAYDDSAYSHDGTLAINPADGRAFSVKLAGDSMTPRFEPGDVAVVYPSKQPKNGGIVLARLNDDHGGDVMLKLYQKSGENVTLSSYNPAYPPMTWPRDAFAWIYPVASVMKVLINL